MRQEPAEKGPEPAWEGNSGTVQDGGWWRWDFVLCLTVALVAAFLLPLDDADLPMHLRTGAWILDNGRVPFVEPFAWTRAGAPFYAYSWLPEVLYEWAWRTGGATGLSGLHALLLGAVVVALWDLARVARWSVWATRLILSVHLVLWLMVQPATRPQLMLAIALPMAWAGAYRLIHASGRSSMLRASVLITVAGVLSVNSHLFFFISTAPVVVLLAQDRIRWPLVALHQLATVAGWSITPYVLYLPDVLRLYLGANALLGAASPISELEGGFSLLMHAALGTRLLVGALLVLPLLPFFAQRTPRERWWYGLAWLAGLGLYGLAVRGLLIWWLLALPLLAWCLASVPLPALTATRRAVVGGWIVSIVGLLFQGAKARARTPRVQGLPHPSAPALAPAVRWLDCAIPRPTGTPMRATTAFDYGSYLTWRTPQLSWSIDGRSIFPDSVARADARQELRAGPPVAPPWRGSDVVLLAAGHATLLDVARDGEWQQVALPVPDRSIAVALWVRQTVARGATRCSGMTSG